MAFRLIWFWVLGSGCWWGASAMANDIKSVMDLEAWKESRKLVKIVYQVTADMPAEERYGLTSQMRRAAISIPSNMAEGFDRHHLKEYVQHLAIAQGSNSELHTQVILAQDLGLIEENSAIKIIDQSNRVGKLIRRLQQALRNKL